MAEEMEETEALAEVVHEAEFVEVAPKAETFDEKQQRLAREDYARRNEEAIAEREEIFRRNKLLKEDEPFEMDPKAGNARCCI